jgi:hypothetical protein
MGADRSSTARSFLTRPPTGTPTRAISPGEGLLFLSLHHHTFSPKGVAGLSFTARIGRARFHRARSASKKDGLAAPYPTLLRLRVARAQKIIRLHPLLCSKNLLRGVAKAALYCANRATTIHLIAPSKLARFTFPGTALVLFLLRPSSEALPRARAPGAQDQRGRHSHFLPIVP